MTRENIELLSKRVVFHSSFRFSSLFFSFFFSSNIHFCILCFFYDGRCDNKNVKVNVLLIVNKYICKQGSSCAFMVLLNGFYYLGRYKNKTL